VTVADETPSLRVGQGFDIHRFSPLPGRPLVLGGVTIPGVVGLAGHSDADVVAHALADALLGAAGLGDLGRHFPDTDPAWAGADSLDLLARVGALAAGRGMRVVNADCTVVCERPRLADHTDEMGRRLEAAVGAPVNVKATRAEGLGTLGRVEGIACLAVVLLTGTAPPSDAAEGRR
jgi:2-C-methyl-D-erythritol 2,4-cyclodiphosphate synthase